MPNSTRTLSLTLLIHAALIIIVLSSISPTLAQPYEKVSIEDSNIKLGSTQYLDHQIHFAVAGNDHKPGLLFIHGTPGSWQAFGQYLSHPLLQRDFFMVSVDRLGWGQSVINQTAPASRASNLLEFKPQAQSIKAIMDLYPKKKWLLVGHSLGASIAPKIALIAPEKVAGMLLLAGTLSPALGKPRWYNVAANLLLIKWLLPSNLEYSNDEIMVLKNELQILENELTTIQLPTEVVVMQGMKDRLVSPKNAQYAQLTWPKTFENMSIIELPKAGHFLPWKQTEIVIQAIRAMPIH